jgi:hypothetical protein
MVTNLTFCEQLISTLLMIDFLQLDGFNRQWHALRRVLIESPA